MLQASTAGGNAAHLKPDRTKYVYLLVYFCLKIGWLLYFFNG